MPVLTEVRRLGGGWPHLIRRVESYMRGISTEGISLVEFEAACLAEVFVPDRPAILKALKGKRLVFPVRDGTAVRVFAQPPEKRRFERGDTSALDQCLRVLAPHMHALAGVVAGNGGIEDRESRRREAEAARQIVELVTRHVDRGLDLDALRNALAITFNAEAVEALSRRQPILRVGGKARDVPAKPEAPPASRRIPNGLPPHDKALALAKKAGPKGITKTTLHKAIQPRLPMAEFDTILDDLTSTALVSTMTLKLTAKGRPALVIFHADYDPPRVVNGWPAFD